MDNCNSNTNTTRPNTVIPVFRVRGLLGRPLQAEWVNTSTDGGTDITQSTRIKNLNLKLKED